MKMQLSKSVIYRIPQFSLQSEINECWQDLLTSIKISSSSFHALVKDLDPNDPNFKNSLLYHTIWKYFNRSRYRATPYGTFAYVGLCKIESSNAPLVIADESIQFQLPDWSERKGITHEFQELVTRDAKLFTNSSYYPFADRIRYIGREKENYELFEIEKDDTILLVLQVCTVPTRMSCLLNNPQLASFGKEKLMAMIEGLLADQLLISEFDVNSIGDDYFLRAGNTENTARRYYLSVREPKSGSLDTKPFRHLPELVERLQRLLPSYYSPDLIQFKSEFYKKYGDVEVPIMEALDPECGIGYGNLEEDGLSSLLVKSLNSNKTRASEDDNRTLKLLLPFLLGKTKHTVQLEDIPVPATTDLKEPLPNTLPVIAILADDLVQVEHIGGATANSLIGRFTPASEDIYGLTQQLAAIEMSANSDIFFFDIDYLVNSEVPIDNINRRKQIYPLQLSLLNYDTSTSPLGLQDILVSVRGDQVILRSRSLNKRLIPRFGSAYNYMLSSLPVFRMLCDMQHQGIHKNLSIRLRDRLPSLSYYPRVQFRNIILSPHTWRLSSVNLPTGVSDQDIQLFKVILKEMDVTKFVRVGNTDQTLCIDIDNKDDLRNLYQVVKKNGTLYLEEIIIPKNAAITDSAGAPYFSQVLLPLYHYGNIYSGLSTPGKSREENRITRKAIAPGGKWLYYKIFCYPARANTLLAQTLAGFLRNYEKEIKKWFFIRYSEGGHHIRLRIELDEINAAMTIASDLNLGFQRLLNEDLIKDISLHTYHPELARYGVKYMDAMEVHFCKDSAYVLKVVGDDMTELELYILCLSVLQEIGNAELFGPDEWENLTLSCSDQFIAEYNLKPEAFKMLNDTFKKLNLASLNDANDRLTNASEGFVNSFSGMLSRYPTEERPTAFVDMWHMHINRLFSANQRSHELAIYYFMRKLLLRKKHITKQGSLSIFTEI